MALEYFAILYPDEEGGYTVEVPDLPGCFTQGETVEEAIAMAKEAASLWFGALEYSERIPESSSMIDLTKYKNARYVAQISLSWYDVQKYRTKK